MIERRLAESPDIATYQILEHHIATHEIRSRHIAPHQILPHHLITEVLRACDGEQIKYEGLVSHERKLELLGNARALLAPYQPVGAEVFGIALLESLAMGTPVMALRNGAVPELIVDGQTGFICDSPEQMGQLIQQDAVQRIQPQKCRQRAAEFNPRRMAQEFIQLI